MFIMRRVQSIVLKIDGVTFHSLASKTIHLLSEEKTPFTKWFEINGQTTDLFKQLWKVCLKQERPAYTQLPKHIFANITVSLLIWY